jgi:hypothetical protein
MADTLPRLEYEFRRPGQGDPNSRRLPSARLRRAMYRPGRVAHWLELAPPPSPDRRDAALREGYQLPILERIRPSLLRTDKTDTVTLGYPKPATVATRPALGEPP